MYTIYLYIYIIHIYICELKVVPHTQIRKDMWARKYHWDWCSVFETRPPGSSRTRHGNSGSKQRTERTKNKKLWSHPSFQEWRGAGLGNLTVRNLLGRLLWYICIFFNNQKDSVFFFKAAAAPSQALGHIICTCDTLWVYFKLVPQKVYNKLTNPCYLVGIKHLVAMAQKQFRPYDHEFPATVNALKRIQPKSTYWCVQGAEMPCY